MKQGLLFLAALVLTTLTLVTPVGSAALNQSEQVGFTNVRLSQSQTGEKSYLEKLFGSVTGKETAKTERPAMTTGDWLLAVPATLFYGQVALLIVLAILFSSSLSGVIIGVVVVGLCLAFTIPKRPRAISLFSLASLNFLLAMGITFNVAFQEGVPLILISLVPLGWLVWLTLKNAFLKKKII